MGRGTGSSPSPHLGAWIPVAAIAAGLACGGDVPSPRLLAVEPAQGYNDQPTRLRLRGLDFIPAVDLDPEVHARSLSARGFAGTVGGAAVTVTLRDFEWISPSELAATLPAGLPTRLDGYPIEITDPRGRRALLPAGFASLGPDQVRPILDVDTPRENAKLAPGTAFTASATVFDPVPGSLASVTWKTWGNGKVLGEGDCPSASPPARTACQFDAAVPENLRPGDIYEISFLAIDASAIGNRTEQLLSYRLVERPILLGIFPRGGSVQGGNDVVIKGRGFFPGTRAFVGGVPLVPDGGRLIDDQTINGRTPDHAEQGIVPVDVHTPVGDATLANAFVYVKAPIIVSVSPNVAPALGGTPVTVRGLGFTAETKIFFGTRISSASPLVAAVLSNFQEVRGLAPPGEGTAPVWALDPEIGLGRSIDEFVWLPPPVSAVTPTPAGAGGQAP